MKPFDLEKALAGEPVLLRSGHTAYVVNRRPDHLVGDAADELIGWKDGGHALSWSVSGRTYTDSLSALDIIGMAPVKQKHWMAVHTNGRTTYHYDSKEKLMNNHPQYDKPGWQVIEIEIEV